MENITIIVIPADRSAVKVVIKEIESPTIYFIWPIVVKSRALPIM